MHTPFLLTDVEVAAFEVRAAIMGFDGGVERATAEIRALQLGLAQRYPSQA